jgi:hypothetical protein
MKLSLTSQNGLIKIPRLRFADEVKSTNVSLSSDGFTSRIELEGPLDSLNWVLTGISFKGKANFNTEHSFEEILLRAEDAGGGAGIDLLFV